MPLPKKRFPFSIDRMSFIMHLYTCILHILHVYLAGSGVIEVWFGLKTADELDDFPIKTRHPSHAQLSHDRAAAALNARFATQKLRAVRRAPWPPITRNAECQIWSSLWEVQICWDFVRVVNVILWGLFFCLLQWNKDKLKNGSSPHSPPLALLQRQAVAKRRRHTKSSYPGRSKHLADHTPWVTGCHRHS